jgi:polysaccharide export outer membrane protein
MRYIIILIVLAIFLFCSRLYNLSAQERIDAQAQARQHYQQGKELYSQGHYAEATTEFQQAMTLIVPPSIEFMERVQTQQEKTLTPGSQGGPWASEGFQKTLTLTIPPSVEFMERVQTQEEKTLAPVAPKTLPLSPKEKLAQKKREEKEKEKEKVIGINKVVAELKPGPETEEGEREYYIDIGDVLDISVWQIADLSRPEVIVRPDGRISFPLIGDVKAEGITLTQLHDTVTEKLKTYVKAPQVSIMIRRFGEQGNKVVILGEIPGPGVYKFSGPPTIIEAIASAGGYTRYAVLNSIMVIRGDVRNKPQVTRVNLAKIIKSGSLSENIFLRPNDIVYVPRSFIGNVNTFLEIFQPAISEYMQYMNARHFQNIMHRNAQ